MSAYIPPMVQSVTLSQIWATPAEFLLRVTGKKELQEARIAAINLYHSQLSPNEQAYLNIPGTLQFLTRHTPEEMAVVIRNNLNLIRLLRFAVLLQNITQIVINEVRSHIISFALVGGGGGYGEYEPDYDVVTMIISDDPLCFSHIRRFYKSPIWRRYQDELKRYLMNVDLHVYDHYAGDAKAAAITANLEALEHPEYDRDAESDEDVAESKAKDYEHQKACEAKSDIINETVDTSVPYFAEVAARVIWSFFTEDDSSFNGADHKQILEEVSIQPIDIPNLEEAYEFMVDLPLPKHRMGAALCLWRFYNLLPSTYSERIKERILEAGFLFMLNTPVLPEHLPFIQALDPDTAKGLFTLISDYLGPAPTEANVKAAMLKL